jgi:hypothetical protein
LDFMKMTSMQWPFISVLLFAAAPHAVIVQSADLSQPTNSWVKRSPLPDTPPSPRLGYEGACAWDSKHHVLIRYGGHNQGGGGEQHAEVWTFDPATAKWELKEPNTSPPGICCGQQNLFDAVHGRYLRFPAFSGSHGWQWWREIYLNDSSVWSYDLASNIWRNNRPVPAPSPRPLRCASWDSDHQVAVVFGGEGSREGTWAYDPYANTWTRMNPAIEPEFRSGGNMAYDAARKLHILFGSQFTDDPHTWAYDLRQNQWRDMKPSSMPPTDQNDAVLTYDPIGRVIVALVKVSQGKDEDATHRIETWAFDAGANKWTKLNPQPEPDSSGNRARVLVFAPELNAAFLENRTHSKNFNEQQIWTYRFTNGPADVPLQPPVDLRVRTSDSSATLTWTNNPASRVSGYEILRGEGNQPWKVDYKGVATIGAKENSWQDKGLKPGVTYCYSLRAIGEDQKASGLSAPARTEPIVVEDVLVSVLTANKVEISWRPSQDAVSYRVERAAVDVLTEDQLVRLKKQTPPLSAPSIGAIRRISQFSRLSSSSMNRTNFVDTTVDLSTPVTVQGEPVFQRSYSAEQIDVTGKPYRFAVYAYRVRAVNALGVESGPSSFCLTIPSAPQWVYAKEEGTACHLKWASNQEKEIKGYRVYRMNGRYDKDLIPRLTAEPVSALAYSDPDAGKTTRRYHIVAVDVLGQEGFPSAPVWFEREWKRFYLPFTAAWHQ